MNLVRWEPWALLAVVLTAGGAVVYRLNAGRSAEAELARRDAVVETQGQVDELTADNAELRAALEAAHRERPEAEPVAVVRVVSQPGAAHGTPRPGGSCICAPSSSPAPEPPIAGTKPDVVATPCLLAEGDEIGARLDEVVQENRDDQAWIVGTITPQRRKPEPVTDLGTVRFDAPLKLAQPAAELARWGFGLAGFADGRGAAVGLAIAPPQLRFWGQELDFLGSAGWGPATGLEFFAAGFVRPSW